MGADFAEMRDIFLGALELQGLDAQLKFVELKCSDNVDLREKLFEMLRAHNQPDGFLASNSDTNCKSTEIFTASEELPGNEIGPYKLLQKIGEGGMGSVFMAEQTSPIRRRVALKVIKPGMDSRQVIARFDSERQALSLMDHPNIAKVLDAGMTKQGRPFFVMELVKGQPITQYCDDNHLNPRQRIELMLPVCNAILHAHQKGIIHRDIKPSNILVAEYDHLAVPKIIDFGVAKAVNQPLTEMTMFTAFGQIVGTLEYMSPEQAKLNQLDIDTRSDIYSLGVVLYELLTGTTPLDRQRLRSAAWDEMLRIIREEEPPKPSTRLSDSKGSLPSISAQRKMEPAKLTKTVRGELDWIVMKALEKDRNRRYDTANGLALDIQRYLDNEPVQACPPTVRYRLSKFVNKHRATTFAASLVLFILLAGVLGTSFGLYRAEQSRKQADGFRIAEVKQRKVAEDLAKSERLATEQAIEAKTRAEAASSALSVKADELRKELYVNLVGRALSDWLGSSVSDSRRRLQSCPKELRQWEWNFVSRLCHLDLWTDAGNGSCVWAVAISPDGNMVASGSGKYLWATEAGGGRITIRDASDGKLIFEEVGLKGGVQGVAFSPDNKYVACCTSYWSPGNDYNLKEGELIVWDVASKKRIWSQLQKSTTMLCVAYSSDGSKIAVGTGGYNSGVGELTSIAAIYETSTGKLLQEIKSTGGSVHSLAFSPNANQIALGESEKVELFNLKDGTLLRTFPGHISYVYSIAFSPDGSRLATGEYSPPVRIWNVETGAIEVFIHGDQARGLSFDRDGGRIAVATGLGQTVKICDSKTGETIATLRGHQNATMCVCFHPDMNRVLSGSVDGVLKMWTAKQQPLVLQHEPRNIEHPWITGIVADWNGRRVFTASRDNTVQLWDSDTGNMIKIWEGPTTEDSNWMHTFWSLAVSPDGRQVFAGHGRGAILRWDAETGEALPALKTKSSMVLALAVSPDGQWLASAALDGMIRLWDIPSGNLVRSIPYSLDGRTVTCLEFSPDSSRLVAGSGYLSFLDSPSGLGLWDVRSGNLLWSKSVAKVSVRDLAFSPDGKLISSALNDGRICICDVLKGTEQVTFVAFNKEARAVQFSPDGKRLFTGGTEGIKVWDTENWSEFFVYICPPVLSLSIGDRGKKLVFGGYYPNAIILDSTPVNE